MIGVNLAIEDQLSETVLRAILRQSGRNYYIGAIFGKFGKGYLEKTINGFNIASKGTPFIVVVDLDMIECVPIMIEQWLKRRKHPNLIFRIAVREIESWVLADRVSFARFLGIQHNTIPYNPDALDDPKNTLISLAKKSRKRYLRDAIVPSKGSTAKIGPDYNNRLSEFVRLSWNLKNAINYSPSLMRTYEIISSFCPKYILKE